MALDFFLYAFAIAITAIIYRRFLAFEDILSWWFRFGDRYFADRWFYKPVWGCEYCWAGQIAFWTYYLNALIAVNLVDSYPKIVAIFNIIPIYRFNDFSALKVVIFVCLTIAFVKVLNYFYDKLEK